MIHKPTESDVADALKEAVKAIYFGDDSDYGTALYRVIQSLGGAQAVELLASDPSVAYAPYCTDGGENADDS